MSKLNERIAPCIVETKKFKLKEEEYEQKNSWLPSPYI